MGLPRALLRSIVAAAALVVALPAAAGASLASEGAQAGARWLVSDQQSNGAFFSPTQEADDTAAAVAAVVSGQGSANAVQRALGYLRQTAESSARSSAANAGRIVAGIVAGGADPRKFGGVDYVKILGSFYDGVTGAYDAVDLADNLVAANGVVAAGDKLSQQAVRYIRGRQCRNAAGSLRGFATSDCASGADVEATAWAVNVLRRSGVKVTNAALVGAKKYFTSVQNDDGGFGSQGGDTTRAEPTGLAVSALYAMGEGPAGRTWKRSGGTPVRALLDLQDSSGGVRDAAASDPDERSTVFAVPGLAARFYPIKPPPAFASPDGNAVPNGRSGDPAGAAVRANGKGTAGVPIDRESPDNVSKDRSPLQSARPCPSCGRANRSYAQPKSRSRYDDHVGRTVAIALMGLVVATTMVVGGVALLRGSHAPG